MKTAKKQFLASVVSLMLCVAMLVGTTFAWFTDSVSSINNIIKSGNLDVELEYLAKDENTGEFEWTAVKEDTALINNDAKWEPGHAEVVYLKASNLGELALKYQLGVNIVEEVEGTNVEGNTFKLSDYVYMGLAKDVDGKTAAFADRKAAISAVSSEATLIEANSGKGGELYPVGNTEGKATEAYFALVIYMPETVGNVANYKKGTTPPELQLGVNIAAIQLTYEGDDFGKDYDDNLNPSVVYATTAQELYDALAAGKDVVLMNDIDMSGVTFSRSGNLTWKAIPSYSGTLDGNGYKITGINSTTGLFNEINGGTVKNLTIEATVSSDTTAVTSVGILANTVKGNVTIDSVTVSGSVESDAASVGGIIGSIEKSDNDDAVVTITNCTSAAAITTVSDDQNVGALVGSVNSNVSVSASTNEGTVNNEVVEDVLGDVSEDVDVDIAPVVSDNAGLAAALQDTAIDEIFLTAGEFTADIYNITARDTLIITGQGADTKLAFSNLQVRASQFKNLTIENCTIERMPNKAWGHLVFGSSYNANGVYTISNCIFNGVGSQGIFINETVSGATYNIENCVFNGDFGCEGAITIQNNADVNVNVNVNGCTFNNIPETSNEIFVHYENKGLNLTVDGKWTVTNSVLLADAVAKGATHIWLADGNYTMPQDYVFQGKTLTISGTKDAVIDISAIPTNGSQAFTNATLVFDGVTLNCATQNYKGFTHAASLTYKNCQINGLQFLYAENVTFENCDFDSNGAEHSIWTYGSKNVSFVDCDFTYADRAVNVYHDNGTGSVNVSFEGCTFTTSNTASKGAVEINSSTFPLGANVSFVNCTAPAYGTMVGISGWDSANGANATVTVDGAEFTPNQWDK